MTLWRAPMSLRLKTTLVVWTILVMLPIFAGLLAVLWIKLAALLFVPGIPLALAGMFLLYLFSIYCAPAQALLGNVCFNDALLGSLLPHPLPCDVVAWGAVAALYSLLAILLAQAVTPVVEWTHCR